MFIQRLKLQPASKRKRVCKTPGKEEPTPPAIGYARNHEKVINVAIVLVNPPALLRKASLREPWNWVFAVVRKPTMKNRNTMVMNGPR